VQRQDQENKTELYIHTCAVLHPGILMMLNLMDYQDRFIALFTETFTSIIPEVKEKEIFPSEQFLLTLANLLDVGVCLDTMKNVKGSMTNDLSMYKRHILLISGHKVF
jgi:cytoplasmic FMR1 interacting protein